MSRHASTASGKLPVEVSQAIRLAGTPFECPVCLDVYCTENDSEPITIPCGHAFCMKHLRDLARHRCPVCRAAFVIDADHPAKVSYSLLHAADSHRAMLRRLEEHGLLMSFDEEREAVRREAEPDVITVAVGGANRSTPSTAAAVTVGSPTVGDRSEERQVAEAMAAAAVATSTASALMRSQYVGGSGQVPASFPPIGRGASQVRSAWFDLDVTSRAMGHSISCFSCSRSVCDHLMSTSTEETMCCACRNRVSATRVACCPCCRDDEVDIAEAIFDSMVQRAELESGVVA